MSSDRLTRVTETLDAALAVMRALAPPEYPSHCPRCDAPLDPAWYSCWVCGRELEKGGDGQ